MKRLLIVTYYWPPSAGSGVQRWLKFSRYLPEFGWQPVIFTPKNPDFAIQDESLLTNIPDVCEVIKRPIWEPYHLYRKLMGQPDSQDNSGMTGQMPAGLTGRLTNWVRGTWFLPDPRRFWVRPSIQFLKDYLAANPVDAMVTTGPPHSMHLIGLGLKRQFPNLPWLADMRDPWATFDIHLSFMGKSSRAKNRRLQQSVLDAADRIVIVSPGSRREFPSANPEKFTLIHNGFDPHDFVGLETCFSKKQSTFRLIHSGLLNAIRDSPAFWEAVSEIVRENPDFRDALEIELIGNTDEAITNRLQGDPLLGPRLRCRGWIPHRDLIRENLRASVFLVFVNRSENAKAQLTGKLYEYLALHRPILALCPRDADIAEVLKSTRAGIVCEAHDTPAIRLALERLFKAHREGSSSPPDQALIDRFSRKSLTKTLVSVLNALTPTQ